MGEEKIWYATIYRKIDDNERPLFSPFVCFDLGHVIKVSGQTFLTVQFQHFYDQHFYIYLMIYKPF